MLSISKRKGKLKAKNDIFERKNKGKTIYLYIYFKAKEGKPEWLEWSDATIVIWWVHQVISYKTIVLSTLYLKKTHATEHTFFRRNELYFYINLKRCLPAFGSYSLFSIPSFRFTIQLKTKNCINKSITRT